MKKINTKGLQHRGFIKTTQKTGCFGEDSYILVITRDFSKFACLICF